MHTKVTFVFENNKAYAFSGGQVVASADSIEELEQKLAFDPGYGEDHAMGDMGAGMGGDMGMGGGMGDHGDPDSYHDGPCAHCGTPLAPGEETCSMCGQPAMGHMPEFPEFDPEGNAAPYGNPGDSFPDHGPMQASVTVTTPGGLKGKVLGKQSGLWADELTVRLENGRIIRVPVVDGLSYERVASTEPEPTLVEQLRARLAKAVDPDPTSLLARRHELDEVRKTAAVAVSTASDADAAALDSITVEARHEQAEIDAALAHLDSEEVENFIPAAPFRSSVVEQESVGRTANWLDGVAEEMIREANATDFERLLSEGPEAFVASLETPALADGGVVRYMAANFVRTKTAAAREDIRDSFETRFLERVEQARRVEAASRKETIAKQAAAEDDQYDSLPDDILFG